MPNDSESNCTQSYTAFSDGKALFQGPLAEVITGAKTRQEDEPDSSILIFRDADGSWYDVDLSGPLKLIIKTLPKPDPVEVEAKQEIVAPQTATRGRPKLGVVAKEVTLLPRHWEWLASQAGGASVTLRKLVETAKKTSAIHQRTRDSEDACNRFIVSTAGDLPQFEEATRALYSHEYEAFERETSSWPQDIRTYATLLLKPAIQEKESLSASAEWLTAFPVL